MSATAYAAERATAEELRGVDETVFEAVRRSLPREAAVREWLGLQTSHHEAPSDTSGADVRHDAVDVASPPPPEWAMPEDVSLLAFRDLARCVECQRESACAVLRVDTDAGGLNPFESNDRSPHNFCNDADLVLRCTASESLCVTCAEAHFKEGDVAGRGPDAWLDTNVPAGKYVTDASLLPIHLLDKARAVIVSGHPWGRAFQEVVYAALRRTALSSGSLPAASGITLRGSDVDPVKAGERPSALHVLTSQHLLAFMPQRLKDLMEYPDDELESPLESWVRAPGLQAAPRLTLRSFMLDYSAANSLHALSVEELTIDPLVLPARRQLTDDAFPTIQCELSNKLRKLRIVDISVWSDNSRTAMGLTGLTWESFRFLTHFSFDTHSADVITDSWLHGFARMPALQVVRIETLKDQSVTNAGFATLSSGAPNLEMFVWDLANDPSSGVYSAVLSGVGVHGLQALVQHPKLHTLALPIMLPDSPKAMQAVPFLGMALRRLRLYCGGFQNPAGAPGWAQPLLEAANGPPVTSGGRRAGAPPPQIIAFDMVSVYSALTLRDQRQKMTAPLYEGRWRCLISPGSCTKRRDATLEQLAREFNAKHPECAFDVANAYSSLAF